MIDKAIVSVFCMAFLIVIFLCIMGMMLSFIQKVDFDQSCRTALLEMDLEGGLTDEKRLELKSNLECSGFLNVVIEAPEEVQYGEWITLNVDASTQTMWWNNLIQRKEGMLYFSYNQKIVSRKIHNFAY